MEFVITVPELIGGGFFLLILNIAVWAFAWGRTWGKVCERVDNVEEKVDVHIKNHPKPFVLPECNKTFLEIGKTLSGLETQMKNVVSEIKELKKRVEV